MKTSILLAGLLSLSGCSMMPAAVDAYEVKAADAVVDSSERTICRDIPVGTWVRRYGASAERIDAWRKLCSSRGATPADGAP